MPFGTFLSFLVLLGKSIGIEIPWDTCHYTCNHQFAPTMFRPSSYKYLCPGNSSNSKEKAETPDLKEFPLQGEIVLKIPRGRPRLGSIPSSGTKKTKGLIIFDNPFFRAKTDYYAKPNSISGIIFHYRITINYLFNPCPVIRFSEPFAICFLKNSSLNCLFKFFCRPVCFNNLSMEIPASERPIIERA